MPWFQQTGGKHKKHKKKKSCGGDHGAACLGSSRLAGSTKSTRRKNLVEETTGLHALVPADWREAQKAQEEKILWRRPRGCMPWFQQTGGKHKKHKKKKSCGGDHGVACLGS